jgi:hypothetical protein
MVKILNLDPKIAAQAMQNIFYTSAMDQDFASSIMAVGDIMQLMGQINRKPDWHTFIDTSFI